MTTVTNDPLDLRIGFVGGHGHHMLRGVVDRLAGGSEAVAVASDGHDAKAARGRHGQFVDAAWFDDYRQMLDRFKPDVVNVGAVYGFNGDVAIEALHRGIAVISDKPVAMSWEQLARVRQACEASGRPLITELPFRATPAFCAARLAVTSGRIGVPVLATAQKSYRFGTRPPWYADRAQYGGTMLWIASHAIDVITFATGRRYTHVFGLQGNVSKPDYGSMEDHATASFVLEGGGAALVHADFLRPPAAPTHGDDRLRIAGSTGVVEVRDGRCVLITADTGPTDITEEGQGPSPSQVMLDAALGQATVYGTQHSLDIAAVLLHARDAADQRGLIALN